MEGRVYVLCDLPHLADPRAGSAGDELSLFVSCLSLIITRAVAMIGWECTKIRAEQSQRGDHRDPGMDTLVSLALAVPTASPFRPSILPFSWGSISCAEEVPGA